MVGVGGVSPFSPPVATPLLPTSTQLRQKRVKCTKLISVANVRVNLCFMFSLSLLPSDITTAAPGLADINEVHATTSTSSSAILTIVNKTPSNAGMADRMQLFN